MKKMFGFQEDRYHLALFKTLEEGEDDGGESRENTMEDIQSLLKACYWLGINPLKELRKILPQFSWKYHKFNNPAEVRRIVFHEDFTWIVTSEGLKRDFHLVTATKKDHVGEPLKFVWINEGRNQEETLAFVESCGGCPVQWEVE